MKTIGMIVMIFIVMFALVIGSMYVSYSNQEIGIRNKFNAAQSDSKVVYDAVWKILQEQAGIADKYAADFKKVYPEIMAGRYSGNGDGSLMKWVTEQNPEFDTSLYANLMYSIQVQREEFLAYQQRLNRIKRAHDDLRLQAPGSIFLKDRPALKLQLVTSTRTQKAFNSGKDDKTL